MVRYAFGADQRPVEDKRLVFFVVLYTDNGNATDRQTVQRHFRRRTVNTVGVGGIVFPNAQIDVALSSALPTWVRAGSVHGPRTAAAVAELRTHLSMQHASTDDLAAAATSAGWTDFGGRLSRLPLEAFQLREGHFSRAPLPSTVVKPLGRLRWEARLIDGIASYPNFKERAAGRPSLRRLPVTPEALMKGGALALEALLSERALPQSWVHAMHVVPPGSPALRVEALQPLLPPTQLESSIRWGSSAPGYERVAPALGPSVWVVDDTGALDAGETLARLEARLTQLVEAAEAATEAATSSTTSSSSATPTTADDATSTGAAVLVLLTHEREAQSHKLLGGAGAETRQRMTAKAMSALRTESLPSHVAWKLSLTAMGALVHARVRKLAADHPRRCVLWPRLPHRTHTSSSSFIKSRPLINPDR